MEHLRKRIDQVQSQIGNIEEELGSNLESEPKVQRLKENLQNDLENAKTKKN